MIKRKNILIYFIAISLITIAKSLPHAILTVFLYSKNLSISEILFTQAIFTTFIIIFNIPSGLLADKYNRKLLYLIANVSLLVMTLIVYSKSGFIWMACAWALYGFSEAMSSGTLDGAILSQLKTSDHAELLINQFHKYQKQIFTFSMILGGSMGSILYFKIHEKIYLLATILILISFFSVLLFFNDKTYIQKGQQDKLLTSLKDGFKIIFRDNRLLYIILLSIVGQIFFQTHFQLWQAYVLSLGISKHFLFYFYITFQIISMAAYNIPITYHLRKWIKLFLLIGVVLPLMISIQMPIVSIAFYIGFIFIFTFLDYMFEVLFSINIPNKIISTLLSLNSSLSQIGGLICITINGIVLKFLTVQTLISINFEISIVLSTILIFSLFKLKILVK